MYLNLFIVFLIVSLKVNSQNQRDSIINKSITKLDEVILKGNTILGNKFASKNRTGSSFYLSKYELSQFGDIDINRVLDRIPGLTVYEEDGFGLRPNISIRGTSPERSSKITIMEDGILAAPAPYSASSAYYFPSVARMSAVEVLKGSSQIQYGPYTTGGVINFVSSEISDSLKIDLENSYGSFRSGKLLSRISNSNETLGYLFEYLNFNSDGFKTIEGGGNTGFDIDEFLLKFKIDLFKKYNTNHTIEFKFQNYNEISNETYLGLTESDYDSKPLYRYPSTQKDKMIAYKNQYVISYILDFSDRFKVTTSAYNNFFRRNWYKIDDIVFNGESQKISKVIGDPILYENHYFFSKGIINSEDDYFKVKANNRRYLSKGIQTKIDYHWYGKGDSFNDLEIGIRVHYDEEDRFQWEDNYSMIAGIMGLKSLGSKGDQGNRISSANALSSYIMYRYKNKGFTLTPGLRFESINLDRHDYGKSNSLRDESNLSTRENNVSALIPGVGMNYTFNRNFSVFWGIHRGFSPPGNSTGQSPENSTNMELGARFSVNKIRGEFILYQNNYKNLLGSDLAASGGTGELDPFNAGKALVNGFEFFIDGNFYKDEKLDLPFSLSYTFTNAKFLSNFESNVGIWGDVSNGDFIPYIPQHQINSNLSIKYRKSELNLSVNYNGSFFTNNQHVDKIQSNLIFDLSIIHKINKNVSLNSKIINLLNNKYIVSNVPAGFRPGHPFGIFSGLVYSL
ncbi:MAG: TonB-dependent receptor [Flavobacteriaceae bacterium TMED212]|nr:MAG: TonB-dependent receptor [Flavobacteriaceae bacterium TMED212]